MVDAIVSSVAERIAAIIEEEIRNEVNLVTDIEKEIRKLSDELQRITYVLDDAERRGFKEKSVRCWLKLLEEKVYEMADVLDEWEIAVLKVKKGRESNDADVVPPPKQKVIVCPSILSSCLSFKKEVVRHDIANKILNVKEKLDELLKEKDGYNFVKSQPTADTFSESRLVMSTSFVDLDEIHGRDEDRDILVSKLLSNGGSQEELGLHILSIVGIGGLGKTTLAHVIYNDSRVKEYFELRIWIRVSDPFDVARIAKDTIKSVRQERCPNANRLDVLHEHVIESISGKRFLLVLDDVRIENDMEWKSLKDSLTYGRAGSKILVTTRNEHVARIMGSRDSEIYHLGQLSNDDCWLLFSRIALFGRTEEEFETFLNIGKEIAKKCKGLPYAAKILGSLFHSKNSLKEWDNILNNEVWELTGRVEVEFLPHLLLIYQQFSHALKNCFSYCAIFPKDYVIDVERLIENWTALGYLGSNIGDATDLELRGQEYFDILAKHSLFQDFEKSDVDGQIKWCKMHDIVYDFAQFIRRNELVKKACQVCDPSLVATVQEYRSLPCRFIEPPLCDCLTILRILSLRGCGFQSMPHEIGNLIHLRWLDLSEIKLSREDTGTICKLYKLQFLRLSSCDLEEIPSEIGNLFRLRLLDLSFNYFLRGLPDSICGLHELQTLNLDCCHSFSKLPQEIHKLKNLKHLHNKDTHLLYHFPQGLGQLTGLHTLTKFHGESRLSKLGLLKNLNHLSGSLELHIRLTDDLVEDSREAELGKKINIQALKMTFYDYMDEKESSLRIDIIDALKPHPHLRYLEIRDSNGPRLPSWISPDNYLRSIVLSCFNHPLSLQPLGELPCLEELCIDQMFELHVLGRNFLGMKTEAVSRDTDVEPSSSTSTASATTNTIISFPKLKKLTFYDCPNWKEWEDITAEEESSALQLMPCLTELTIKSCEGLTVLPHHLLRKASSLEVLDISGSAKLQQGYVDNNGPAWKSISKSARLRIVL